VHTPILSRNLPDLPAISYELNGLKSTPVPRTAEYFRKSLLDVFIVLVFIPDIILFNYQK
jgi:hypothetical protein